MDYNPNSRYRLQLQVPYYRIPKTRNRNRPAMNKKAKYYRLDTGDKYLYIKAITKKEALNKIIKVLNPPKKEYITILNDLEEIDKDTYNLHFPKFPAS